MSENRGITIELHNCLYCAFDWGKVEGKTIHPATRFDDFAAGQKAHHFLRNLLDADSQAILDSGY
jgi:hypothetical protein